MLNFKDFYNKKMNVKVHTVVTTGLYRIKLLFESEQSQIFVALYSSVWLINNQEQNKRLNHLGLFICCSKNQHFATMVK